MRDSYGGRPPSHLVERIGSEGVLLERGTYGLTLQRCWMKLNDCMRKFPSIGTVSHAGKVWPIPAFERITPKELIKFLRKEKYPEESKQIAKRILEAYVSVHGEIMSKLNADYPRNANETQFRENRQLIRDNSEAIVAYWKFIQEHGDVPGFWSKTKKYNSQLIAQPFSDMKKDIEKYMQPLN